jgi:hypothetical protein
MYFYHDKMPPWGISEDHLRATVHPLLFTNLEVDTQARMAEVEATEKLGWVSGDIFKILWKKGVIVEHDFGEVLRQAAYDKPQIRTEVRNRVNSSAAKVRVNGKIDSERLKQLFNELNTIDHEILPTLCLERRPKLDVLLGINASPDWAAGAQRALEIFLNPNFRLLPRLSDLDDHKQSVIRECAAKIAEIQAEPMIKLATGAYDYHAYQDELVDKGERDYDYLIDPIFENYEDPFFRNLNYKDKLGRFLDVREKFLPTFQTIVEDHALDDEKKHREFENLVHEQRDQFLWSETTARLEIMANGFVPALVTYWVSAAAGASPIEAGVGAGLSSLATQLVVEKIRSRDPNKGPFRFGAAKVEIKRKLESEPESPKLNL